MEAIQDIFSAGRLNALLQRQAAHDAGYHRDIERLSRGPRLQHLALHIAKYVGRIAASPSASPLDLTRTLGDCAIICLSACNALGMSAQDISAFVQSDRHSVDDANERPLLPSEKLALRLAVFGGRLAKTCEALDHLEPIDYATDLRAAILHILSTVLHFSAGAQIDLADVIARRWHQIEEGRVL